MSVPENNLRDDNGNPPSVSIEVKKLKDLPRTSKQWSDVHLPVDILLLTVENCEFLACHYYLRDAFKSYSQSLGFVYFGNMGDQDKPWKVALVKCSKGSSDPGGSQTTLTNAVTLLRPKITFCVGFCKGLNRENTNLGDVVVSCKLTTEAYKTPVSRNVGNLVRNVADGWHPPLDCPEAFREVKVHCDGEILSCPGPVSDEQHTKMHPEAIAVEMEGKGVFTAAYDLKSEWVVVKGVSCFADSSANKSWEAFASVMAASVVANLLSDHYVFEQWPHHGGMSAREDSASSNTKRETPCSSGQPDAKRTKLAVQPTEQDVKDMNRKQELDQYEDHDTWLEMVKQDWESFNRLLDEEQTDQQRKRLNLFVARFQDQFPVKYVCNGCSLKLSGIRYRCLNCVDVDFCYDCYMKRVKVKGHSENHEVIEMRFKCADCKGFILGKRFCCYDCPELLCSGCQSRHPAAHKVTKVPVDKETFVEKCQKQLHSYYNTFNKVKIIPWERASAIHIDEIYTQLSWVRDDRKASGVTQKVLEDYTDIFKGDKYHPNPKRLLVYGRPGVGKSTFSQKTAFDWSNQRKGSLMKFDVVLLIKLRDVCDLKDIRDVLRASELLAGDEMVSADDVYEYMLRNQEKVLLILDGYDEYFCTCKQSPVRDIWDGKLLRGCHVIITTRNEKTDELRLPSHVQFEINGFKSNDQIRSFARRFLGEQDVEDFLSYLEKKQLKGIVEIPLLLSMLCLVWKENRQRELLKSRADIYTKFLETLLHHAIEKDAKPKQFRKINDYKKELCELGKLALDALSEDKLAFPLDKLPDGILATELIEVGLFQVLNVPSVDPEKAGYFLHKSVQEFLAAFYLKEELLKETSTSCLSQVDSIEKIVKMIEVLRFTSELSANAACTVLSHMVIVGKQEGLTEYKFTKTPCIEDLSNDQQLFLTLILQTFFFCASEKRRDLYPMILYNVGGILFIDSDQLHSIANTHMLKSAVAPDLILFSRVRHTEQSYQDLMSVLEDLNAVIVSCSGERKASDFLKKYSLHEGVDIFLKKEGGKIYLYISQLGQRLVLFPTEMLRELLSSPEFTRSKKPVDNQSNEQGDSSALCLTENSTSDTQATQHCLSCVSRINADVKERQEMETLIDVLSFATSLRTIVINGYGSDTDPVLVDQLVSRINFTNRLNWLVLQGINLTPKPAAVIARSLSQAPNLSWLDLSWNPLGEGVSDLTRHLSRAADLKTLRLDDVKMTKKQVNDLSEAVHQSKILDILSCYHDKEGNPIPEQEWPSEDYFKSLVLRRPSIFYGPETVFVLTLARIGDKLYRNSEFPCLTYCVLKKL